MINSMITIGGHLTNRVMCNSKGAPIDLPDLLPSVYQFRLKLIDVDANARSVQVYPNVTALSASIGLVYAEPRAGTFKLRYGTGTTTAAIDFKDNAEDFKTKLAVLTGSTTYGLDVVYQPTPSTWVCRFLSPPPDPGLIDLNGYENELEPETFIRSRQFIQNAETWVEIRLLQGPVASTNDHDTVLGGAPSVQTIRDGYTEDDGITVIVVNEIQAITVPADFTGTYIIKYQGRQSIALSANDGAQSIQDAMNRMYGDNVTRFAVTNPELNRAYVEFVGPFSGLNMDPLQVAVSSEGNPDISFQVNLYTTEVAEALQRNPEVQAIFEVRIHITDPAFEDDPGQDVILFQEPVRIVRPLHWEGLEEAAPINWLFPPNPKDYIPYTQDQIIVGFLTYAIPFGDGTAHDYVIAHDLNTSNLQVSVRQNALNGLQLKDEDFSVTFTNNNSLTVHIPTANPAPATNSLIVVILSSGPIEAFLAHHHTIGQIDGLQELLDSILRRLSALEALLPTIIGLIPGQSVFGTDPGADMLVITINDEWNLVPTNRPPETEKFDPRKLAPAGLLLPAVHDVIDLGSFTAQVAPANTITLGTAYTGFVAGQRARIYTPQFIDTDTCTFNSATGVDTVTVTTPPHGLVAGRRVKFSGGKLPEALSSSVIYYVINPTTSTFQLALVAGGPPIILLTNGDAVAHHLFVTAEVPGGLESAVDYFIRAGFTSTVFQLSATIGGPAISITDAGHPTVNISTVEEITSHLVGTDLPDPGPLAGNVYSVRSDLFLRGGRGIRSETVHAGDLIASDGRVWYHVTRSDVPGSNSFYPVQMEQEICRIAINENMLPAGGVFTLTFDLSIQMFKQDCNVQYLMVIEIAELPEDVLPSPTGPNLFEVVWNKTPLMQQRIIVTDTIVKHKFGAQVVHKSDGTFKTNRKQYGVELAGGVVPSSANFAIRARLIEFDTEDNISDASGLIYYTMEKAQAGVTKGNPTTPDTTVTLP